MKFAIQPPQNLPVEQMALLYGALRTIHDVVWAISCRDVFRAEGPVHNLAGEFLDELCDLIGRASDDIAARAQAAQIADRASDAFASRAEVLVEHELNTNGVSKAAEVAIALYGKPGEAA